MRTPLSRAVGPVALVLAAFTIAPAAAAAKSYSAERFDSRVRLMPGGTLEVTETVVFRFESAKYLKRHPGSAPPWFRALSTAPQDGAFASFVTSSGAGGAAGAGAAGGGSSGAG